jgi:hypothetical protein
MDQPGEAPKTIMQRFLDVAEGVGSKAPRHSAAHREATVLAARHFERGCFDVLRGEPYVSPALGRRRPRRRHGYDAVDS